MSPQVSEIDKLALGVSADAIASWDETKRNEFVNTFDARVRAARFILLKTASIVADTAQERFFVSAKHLGPISNEHFFQLMAEVLDHDPSAQYYSSYARSYSDNSKVGGRPARELVVIAQQRAKEILDNLPALNQAVRILNPEMAKVIEKRDKMLQQARALLEQSEELAGKVDMDDFDQNMTLRKFQATIKQRQKKRKDLFDQMQELGQEGQKLTARINKFLYAGLPGLSDAVVDVIKDHLERAEGFSTMNRRVGERVKFGDSKCALEILQAFEKDEVEISGNVKAQFQAALEKLKLAGIKNQKKLKVS